MPEHTCSIDGCEEKVYARSWCLMHYWRWYRHGDPAVTLRPYLESGNDAERFWVKVDKNGPNPEYAPHLGACWLWLAAKNSEGYGVWAGRYAHRHSYALANGPIPDVLQLDHLCRVRHCVRPEHLEAVTARINALRSPFTTAAINAAKTHCPKGHPYDEENTRYTTSAGTVALVSVNVSSSSASNVYTQKRILAKLCYNGSTEGRRKA